VGVSEAVSSVLVEVSVDVSVDVSSEVVLVEEAVVELVEDAVEEVEEATEVVLDAVLSELEELLPKMAVPRSAKPSTIFFTAAEILVASHPVSVIDAKASNRTKRSGRVDMVRFMT